MQKKIIALAIAAALTSPALALAATTVYGQANLSIDMENDGAVTNSTSTNHLTSNASRIGVKGSEDLSGGLTAVWQMEGTVGMDTGNTGSATTTLAGTTVANAKATTIAQVFDRDTYLGVASATAGTVVLGRHDTPYKMATRNLDVFADDTAADNRSLMGGLAKQDLRLSNVIAYISPAMSGLTVAAATVFGAETAAVNATKGSAVSLAGMYNQGAIYATLAYQTIKVGSNGSGDMGADSLNALLGLGNALRADDKATAVKLGGSYSVDQGSVGIVVERTTNAVAALGASNTTGTNLYLAGKFHISSTDAAKLAYTKRGETSTGGTKNLDSGTQISVGYDHDMSKTTTVYALYSKTTRQGNMADPSALSVGIKHSF